MEVAGGTVTMTGGRAGGRGGYCVVFQVEEGGGAAVQERHRLLLAEQGSQGEQEV